MKRFLNTQQLLYVKNPQTLLLLYTRLNLSLLYNLGNLLTSVHAVKEIRD